MANVVKFWDRIAKRYSRSPIADEASYQKKLELTQRYLSKEMNVLELGCGTGSTAIIHSPYVNHIQGVDISSNMLAIAQRKVDEQGIDNITFERAAIDQLQVADGSKDAVLALSVLHLLEDRDAAIANIYRMLKPGGIFVSSTVCLENCLRFIRYVAPIGQFFGLLPLLKVFSVDQLLLSMRQAGFEVEEQWQPAKNKALFIIAKKPS